MHIFPQKIGPWNGEYHISQQRLSEQIARDKTLEDSEGIALQIKFDYLYILGEFAKRFPAQVAYLLERTTSSKPLKVLKTHGHSTNKEWIYLENASAEGKDLVAYLQQNQESSSGWLVDSCNPASYILPDALPAIYPLQIISPAEINSRTSRFAHSSLIGRGKLSTIEELLKHVTRFGLNLDDFPPIIKTREKIFEHSYALAKRNYQK